MMKTQQLIVKNGYNYITIVLLIWIIFKSVSAIK